VQFITHLVKINLTSLAHKVVKFKTIKTLLKRGLKGEVVLFNSMSGFIEYSNPGITN